MGRLEPSGRDPLTQLISNSLYVEGFTSKVIHAENPNNPGFSLCGRKLGRSASPAGEICIVCEDLTKPRFIDR